MPRLFPMLLPLLLMGAAPAEPFEYFFAKFQKAVAQADGSAIAGHTRTPFLFEGKTLDAAGFTQAAPRLFDAPIRACFATARPVVEGNQRLVFCEGTIFVFAPEAGHWRFTEIGVDD